jgi:hypothetical protein
MLPDGLWYKLRSYYAPVRSTASEATVKANEAKVYTIVRLRMILYSIGNSYLPFLPGRLRGSEVSTQRDVG